MSESPSDEDSSHTTQAETADVASEEEIVNSQQVQQYKASITKLIDKGESPRAIRDYKNSVLELYNLPLSPPPAPTEPKETIPLDLPPDPTEFGEFEDYTDSYVWLYLWLCNKIYYSQFWTLLLPRAFVFHKHTCFFLLGILVYSTFSYFRGFHISAVFIKLFIFFK